MTRFAWLQSRAQVAVAAGLLAALAVAAAITGVQMSHLFHSSVAHCTSGCGFAIDHFLAHNSFMERFLDIVARAVPALLGMFWGAPLLAREMETGTFRLAWTQSITRTRWLVTKLAIGAAATAAIAGLLTLTITWWFTSRDQVGGSRPFALFDRRDVVPIAYAVFAFAVGAMAGAIMRRTVPAMAATLGVFVFTRIAISIWVRPHFMRPLRQTLGLQGAGPEGRVQLGLGSSNGGPMQLFLQGDGPPRSWTVSSHPVTGSGHQVSAAQLSAYFHQHCPHVGPPPRPEIGSAIDKVVGQDAGRACLAQVAKSFKVVVSYQPADRYWTFQWLETGIFGLLAVAAALACVWWVTRRAR